MRRKLILLALVLTLAGCYVGRRAEDLPLAREPRGANVELRTRNGAVNGELLEVQETALLVLSAQRITLVSFSTIRRGTVEMMPGLVLEGQSPGGTHRQRLQRISRFPQGLTAETRRALLAAHDQSEIEVIRP